MQIPKVTDVTVIIPSLNPDDKFIATIDSITHNGFTKIVIVNDGSDVEHLEPFEYAKQKGCIVLSHDVNRGKGAALKTAYEYCYNDKDCIGVVTVDGDGQHDTESIFLCCMKMVATNKVVLGCRDFSGSQVPFKSKYGNNITKFAFRALCGIKLSDTQTGLRAIPVALLPFMRNVSGDRFEYETNVLMEMKRANIQWLEQKITTIYLDDNASTHFRPFRDGWNIYKIIFKHSFERLFKYMLSSGLSAVLDIGVFYFLLLVLNENTFSRWGEAAFATVIARLLSSALNFLVNRNLVFKSGSKKSIGRYYALCIVQLAASMFFVSFANTVLKPTEFWETVIKVVVDTLLFFVSFNVQSNWVFADEQTETETSDYDAATQGRGITPLLRAAMQDIVKSEEE